MFEILRDFLLFSGLPILTWLYRRRKAINRLAKLHEKVINQRNDFQNKLSFKLISENQAVSLETLNVKGMVKITV